MPLHPPRPPFPPRAKKAAGEDSSDEFIAPQCPHKNLGASFLGRLDFSPSFLSSSSPNKGGGCNRAEHPQHWTNEETPSPPPPSGVFVGRCITDVASCLFCRFCMEILQNCIARERETMSWKRREVSAMMTATTRRYLLLRHLSSSHTGGKGGGAHARIGGGFWRRQYHHQCASFTRSALDVSREGFVFWRGFAARSSIHTARDGGRNRAFSSASSVLSSNKSASSSSESETDDDSDDENENDSEMREKEEQKRGLRLREEGTSETSSSSSVTNKIVNIPNALSVGRAVSGPIISYMIIQGPDVYSSELVLTSIALAGISDYADGYLARRWTVSYTHLRAHET